MPLSNDERKTFFSDRVLGIILGASAFPESMELQSSDSFQRSAAAFERYIASDSGLDLPTGNLLDLFDSDSSPGDQILQIQRFIRRRVSETSPTDKPTDVIIYYVGHGFNDSLGDFCLAVRKTHSRDSFALRGVELVSALSGPPITFMRLYLILDCCFGASLNAAFRPPIVAGELAPFSRGVTMLCASSQVEPALAPPSEKLTNFTEALLLGLKRGSDCYGRRMSTRELRSLTKAFIRPNSPTPEVHSPVQICGDIAEFPFFPNLGLSDKGTSINQVVTARIEDHFTQTRVAAERVAFVKKAVTTAVSKVLSTYAGNGLHIAPTIPVKHVNDAWTWEGLLDSPQNMIGLAVFGEEFYFKKCRRGLSGFAIFAHDGIYLTTGRTDSLEKRLRFLSYCELTTLRITSTSQTQYMGTAGKMEFISLRVGPHFISKFYKEKTAIGIYTFESLLDDIQSAVMAVEGLDLIS